MRGRQGGIKGDTVKDDKLVSRESDAEPSQGGGGLNRPSIEGRGVPDGQFAKWSWPASTSAEPRFAVSRKFASSRAGVTHRSLKRSILIRRLGEKIFFLFCPCMTPINDVRHYSVSDPRPYRYRRLSRETL